MPAFEESIDIFISYVREDQVLVEKLAVSLKEEGWQVWYDQRIDGGENWEKVIFENLKKASCVLILFSSLCLANC